ncbi:hypothetical protein GCM10009039_27430 [Halocalculus aciditolerans]|uniref:Uncharacterized protein n=1 Tax=Halocalculus aciditolerans TaxID=1383812 RepID=A0A830FPL9_9EURY|nr:hypothetical protein GCM10009039_27430 [Halocalculus aciditolerans]
MGNSFTACASNTRLTTIATAVAGTGRDNPSEYSNPIAHATSNNPATTSRNHDILPPPHPHAYRLLVRTHDDTRRVDGALTTLHAPVD